MINKINTLKEETLYIYIMYIAYNGKGRSIANITTWVYNFGHNMQIGVVSSIPF